MHCRIRDEAEQMLRALRDRLTEYGLKLNLQKTHIAYCEGANQSKTHEHQEITFLDLPTGCAADTALQAAE